MSTLCLSLPCLLIFFTTCWFILFSIFPLFQPLIFNIFLLLPPILFNLATLPPSVPSLSVSWNRCHPHNERKSDQAHSHGPGSCGSYDRMAKLGHADGGLRGRPPVPHHYPGAGKGAAAGERRLQRPKRRGEGGSFCSRSGGWGQELHTCHEPVEHNTDLSNTHPDLSFEFRPQASCSSLRSQRQRSWRGHRWTVTPRSRDRTRAAWLTSARSTKRASPVEVKDCKHVWGWRSKQQLQVKHGHSIFEEENVRSWKAPNRF